MIHNFISKVRGLSKDKPYLLFLSSALLITVVISILIGTVFWVAHPTVMKMGVFGFIFGDKWGIDGRYGIWVYIVGTFVMTAVTMCMAIPLGLFTAIYLAEFAHPKLRYLMKSSVELLVGIPSVVYGIFGLFILKDFLRDYFNPLVGGTLGVIIPFFRDMGGNGEGVFLASVVLTIMVVPTIISISEDALRSVSRELREGSAALGATKWETIQKLVVPIAMPGIMAGVTLGMMRAIGETMAIVMLLGNSNRIPSSIFDTGYAMTSKILNDIMNNLADDEISSALFGIAAVLFMITALLIGIARIVSNLGCSRVRKNA